MKKLFSKWWCSLAIFAASIAALALVAVCTDSAQCIQFFDQNGYSPFELATLPVFFAIIPAVWIAKPFDGSPLRQNVLSSMVTIVVIMAIVKETDLHNAALHCLFPGFVGENGSLLPGLVKPNGAPLTGTPFKMRVLTNSGVPFAMKAVIVAYFISFFGMFAAGLAYLAKSLFTGMLKLKASAWSVACLGASGIMVQITDRLPSWLNHGYGLNKNVAGENAVSIFSAIATAFEEGGEMMLALFAILAIIQARIEKNGRRE